MSLLDHRHVLIKLHLERDFSRLWGHQVYYIEGNKPMRLFKWTPAFRCTEESSVVSIWISLPYLPIHYMNNKQALHAIASTVGNPLRVDQATAAVTRPTVARILIEYDIATALIPRIWIGEGESGFWQDVIFENVPDYCTACKHLGHAEKNCYIANPQLRKPARHAVNSQQKKDTAKPQNQQGADHRPKEPMDTRVDNQLEKGEGSKDSIRPACDVGYASESESEVRKETNIDLGQSKDAIQVQFNAQVMELLGSSRDSGVRHTRSDEDRRSDEGLSDDGRPASESNLQDDNPADPLELVDRFKGVRVPSSDDGFMEPRTTRSKARNRRKSND